VDFNRLSAWRRDFILPAGDNPQIFYETFDVCGVEFENNCPLTTAMWFFLTLSSFTLLRYAATLN